MTQLVTAPLKVVRFALRTGRDITLGVLRRVRPGGAAAPRGRPRPSAQRPAARAAPVPPPHAAAPPPTPAAPRHVSREAEVVASSGPAEDPGATVHVAEPWAGYDQAPAREIIARLRDADATTKAAVALYERRGKERTTVLDAAQR